MFQFLIVGVVRNCSKSLLRDVSRINRAFSHRGTCKWFLVESDSTDNTLGVLQQCRSLCDLDFVTLGDLKTALPKRTERIAFCRNFYVSHVRGLLSDGSLSSSLVVVVDLDGVNNRLSSSAVDFALEEIDAWDACFPNQLGRYYDVWAMRHDYLSPNDCWAASDYLQAIGLPRFRAETFAVYSRFFHFPEHLESFDVDSAFGGLALYKAACFLDGSYIGITPEGREVCEHVSFNLSLKDRDFRLKLLPGFINGGWNHHSISSFFIFRILNLFFHWARLSFYRALKHFNRLS